MRGEGGDLLAYSEAAPRLITDIGGRCGQISSRPYAARDESKVSIGNEATERQNVSKGTEVSSARQTIATLIVGRVDKEINLTCFSQSATEQAGATVTA